MRSTPLLSMALALALACSVQAKTFADKRGGYSFDLPSGWTLDKKAKSFTVRHTDGSSLESAPPLPASFASLKTAVLMARATALASGFCGEDPASEFELFGAAWVGSGYHCNNRITDKSPPSEVIGFVARHGETCYTFVLFIPRQDWNTKSEEYLS